MKFKLLLAALAATAGTLAHAETIAVDYACDAGKRLQVRYVVGGGNPSARVNIHGRTVRMALTTAGNDEQDVFRGGGYQMLTDKFYEASARETPVNQVSRQTTQVVSGGRMPVDAIVAKNCLPE